MRDLTYPGNLGDVHDYVYLISENSTLKGELLV